MVIFNLKIFNFLSTDFFLTKKETKNFADLK